MGRGSDIIGQSQSDGWRTGTLSNGIPKIVNPRIVSPKIRRKMHLPKFTCTCEKQLYILMTGRNFRCGIFRIRQEANNGCTQVDSFRTSQTRGLRAMTFAFQIKRNMLNPIKDLIRLN